VSPFSGVGPLFLEQLDLLFGITVEEYMARKDNEPERRHDYKAQPEEWVLREAMRLVMGERNGDYGDAVEDFRVIAYYWNNYLHSTGRLAAFTELNAKDVALMMTLLKIRRESTHPKMDNVVDGCGYLALAQKCEEEDGT